jgi:hypothetical protein
MKPPLAHVSQTALVVVAAAGAIWLSAFFLPGAGVQPVPLLPSIGSVAGKVVSVSERHHAAKRAARHRTIAAPIVVRAPFVPPRTVQAVQPQPAPRAVQRAHRPHPAAKPKRSAPAQTAVPASTPASAHSLSFYSTAPRGRAVGWHRKHAASTVAPAAAATHGHGKPHARHDHAPPAEPAAVTTSTPAAPAAPPAVAGHDNGNHNGDGHDHGDDGHGPGGKK